jgi:hypothetical protein
MHSRSHSHAWRNEGVWPRSTNLSVSDVTNYSLAVSIDITKRPLRLFGGSDGHTKVTLISRLFGKRSQSTGTALSDKEKKELTRNSHADDDSHKIDMTPRTTVIDVFSSKNTDSIESVTDIAKPIGKPLARKNTEKRNTFLPHYSHKKTDSTASIAEKDGAQAIKLPAETPIERTKLTRNRSASALLGRQTTRSSNMIEHSPVSSETQGKIKSRTGAPQLTFDLPALDFADFRKQLISFENGCP